MNELKLQFGTAPANPSTSVGLAFVSSPEFSPDTSIAVLPINKFCVENDDKVQTLSAFQTAQSTTLKVQSTFAGSTVMGLGSGIGAWTLQDTSQTIDLEAINFTYTTVNKQINTLGAKITNANSWGIELNKGVVFRNYTIPDYEQADVWFRRGALSSILTPGTACLLIYTVPEINYNPVYNISNDNFPGASVQYNLQTSNVIASSDTEIAYPFELDSIHSITINGVTYSSTNIVKSHDTKTKRIRVTKTLSPDDRISLTYYHYPQTYTYLGYRDGVTNQYYPFDANPEYGHFMADSRYGMIRSSYDCLAERVTVYAIPSAVGVYTVTAGTSGNPPTCSITFYSAYDFNETHFVRHIVGESLEDIVPRIGEGSLNTYGFSLFGKNYYDEPNVPKRDIFSRAVPSMLPLARVLLKAPLSSNTVVTADMRVRGGGIPEDFDFNLLSPEPTATISVKSFYDVATWGGQPLQEGGVTTITIDPSVLAPTGNFTHEEIYEIVKKRIPPGIEFIVKFSPLS